MIDSLINFVRDQYGTNDPIPLHAPVFGGNEHRYVAETIDSTFVSSVGAFVDKFERDMAGFVHSPRAIAAVNGTAALHVALMLAGVTPGDLVLTQALTFVATSNAIRYCGAEPIFIDVDLHTLGLSPSALEHWLGEHASVDNDGICRLRSDNKAIKACLPMHTFGHPVELESLMEVCQRWHLALVEDAAESLGSFYKGKHTGTFGSLGTLSFNGNKIITTGGGGMILCDETLGIRAKHLTTTSKKPHPYEYVHDEVGFNYRLPNINAALGCAQLEQLTSFLQAKRNLASQYRDFLKGSSLNFVDEPRDCQSNFWLNAAICENRAHRDSVLKATNDAGVMTRPIWQLMNRLPSYQNCLTGSLNNSEWLAERVVNLPSSVPQLS